jgi:membrane protein
VSRAWRVAKRSVVSFYDDQGTHHAAALTYYALMSLFPTLLLAVSLLGLLGEFPATYEAIIGHLRAVVPATTLAPLDTAVRAALKSKGTAAAGLAIAIVTALYGATGYLEAARRALNVVFESVRGRSFVRRKLIDVASTFVLMTLVLTTLVLMFAGGGIAREVLGSEAASVWRIARWPGAFASALLAFSFIYHVTPDVDQRAFRWITPGAVTGVAVWLAASAAFSTYLANFKSFNVTYGTFAAAIILLVWLWLTNVALLFGAEVNAEIERVKEITAGVAQAETLDLPTGH